MTDYHPLIARAVDGLAKNTGEARRALYERARAALVTQLRGVEPALSESDITKERLGLEEAIRRVEAEAARKALSEPRMPRPEPRAERRPLAATARSMLAKARSADPEPAPDPLPEGSDDPRYAPDGVRAEAGRNGAKPSARNRILQARTSSLSQQGLKGFRDVVSEVDDLGPASSKAAQSARFTRDSYGDMPPPSEEAFYEPFVAEDLEPSQADPQHRESDEVDDYEPAAQTARSARPHPPRGVEAEEDYEQPRPPRSYRGLVSAAVLLLIFGALAAGIAWQWPTITGLYQLVASSKSRPPSQAAPSPASQNKLGGRVPQPGTDQAVGGAASGSAQAPQVAQRAALYEADPNIPDGKRFAGSVIWRNETVSPGPGLAPELAVRADVEIPERHLTMTWSLRRNSDPALQASHTIEIKFELPPDFTGGGVSNMPGILMKDSEEVRGMPLAGVGVKVTNRYFIIGLNATDADVQRNVQLLKTHEWFDIPIVYGNGSRALLTMEKGAPGDRAFAEAFAAWK